MANHENNHEKIESLFKDIASLYAEKEGKSYKKELAELEKEDLLTYSLSLDKKVRIKITGDKLRRLMYTMMPVAAALFLCVYYFTIRSAVYNTSDRSNAMSAEDSGGDITLLSSSLPDGYRMTGMDSDIGKTIYYIESDTRNPVVIVQEPGGELAGERFREIQLDQVEAYLLVKQDYCVLQYKKEGILYTMSCPYDYADLIILGKNLV